MHSLTHAFPSTLDPLPLLAVILSGLNLGFPLSRKCDYREENDYNRNHRHLVNVFYFAPSHVLCIYCLISSLQQGTCIIILTFQMKKVTCQEPPMWQMVSAVICMRLCVHNSSVWVYNHFLITELWARSWEWGIWPRKNYGYGDLLCIQCLVQIHILSHLLRTNTLPLFTGRKN